MLAFIVLMIAQDQTERAISYYDGILARHYIEVLLPNGSQYLPVFPDRYGNYRPSGSELMTRERRNELLSGDSVKSTQYQLITFGHKYGTPIYHFASYRLIRGTISKGPFAPNRFIPELGSKIITIDTYLQSKEMTADNWRDDPDIQVERPARQQTSVSLYNLPGYFIPSASNKPKSTLSSFPQQPTANFGDVAPSDGTFKFVPMKAHRISIRYGDFIYSGVVAPELGEVIYDDPKQRIKASTDPRPPLPPWLMEPQRPDEAVYEHRCGRLIPGFLHQLAKEEWLFVPDIGGTVIDAKEYLKTYQPGSRRIYNLPGKFQK